MYKNFNITESEKEQILNRLKNNGYGQPINEQSGHGVGQMGDHLNPEQDAVDIWGKSKDLIDFKKLMMNKGYSDDESYGLMKKMIDKFGVGNHNVQQQPLKPATPVQNLNRPKIQVPQPINDQSELSEFKLSDLSDDMYFARHGEDPNGWTSSSNKMYRDNEFGNDFDDETYDDFDTLHNTHPDFHKHYIGNTSNPDKVSHAKSMFNTYKEKYGPLHIKRRRQMENPLNEGKQVLINTFKKLIK